MLRNGLCLLIAILLFGCGSESKPASSAFDLEFDKLMLETVGEQFQVLEISSLACHKDKLLVIGMIRFETDHPCDGLSYSFVKEQAKWSFTHQDNLNISAEERFHQYSKSITGALSVYEFKVMDRFQKLAEMRRNKTG